MRLLASIIVALVTSAVALFIAADALSDFEISTLTFPVLVIEFAVILLIARAAIETMVADLLLGRALFRRISGRDRG